MILRIVGFVILILLLILLPIYKIFGIAYEFWIALAVCAMLSGWCYILYRNLYSKVECPNCHHKMTFQQFQQTAKCPTCHRELHSKTDKS